MENAAAHCCPRNRVELAKIAENKLTADRSTTELRWIFFRTVAERESCPRPLRRQVLPCAQKLPLKTAAATAECRFEKLVAGAGFEPAVPQTRDY
jgi:hypothetical protein